jgi:glutamate--cysteine ligase
LAEPTSPPIASFDELLLPFREAVSDRRRIGVEMEKIGVHVPGGAPITYSKDIARIFEALEQNGWARESEKPGAPTIAMRRGEASVTLEPGGQVELSGSPLEDIHAVAAELRAHQEELAPVSRELGIVWLGLGFHPFARREELEWVPKARYGLMREYLPKRGGHALDMMLRTCTVQANFDYASETDAMRKMRVLLRISPVVSAIFANSPFVEGRPFGGVSFRSRVWLDVDPDRAGLVPRLFSRGATFADYVEWALDVPMFLFKRGGEVIANTGQPFRDFWKNGFRGHAATQADWVMHLGTLFPEVRLKRTIEVRGADSQSLGNAPALPALFTGILYDEQALSEAEALTEDWTYEEVYEVKSHVGRHGLRAPFRGDTLLAPAQTLLIIARGGLLRRAKTDARGRDESVYLAPIEALLAKGQCPADALLAALDGTKDFREEIVRIAAL